MEQRLQEEAQRERKVCLGQGPAPSPPTRSVSQEIRGRDCLHHLPPLPVSQEIAALVLLTALCSLAFLRRVLGTDDAFSSRPISSRLVPRVGPG